VVGNGVAERSDGKDVVNGTSGVEATHEAAPVEDAPQRPNGNHVTASGGKGAVANGVARVEVELLDGSAKDVRVLGAQGAVAMVTF